MSEVRDDELAASTTAGFKVGEKRTAEELAALDQGDESLNKWKASLGLGATTGASAVNVEIISLTLTSDTRPGGAIVFDLSKANTLKDTPIIIKEGSDYSVELTFKVNNEVVSGLKYIQVVKRAGINLDKLEKMLGSYGPSPSPVVKKVTDSTSPDGMIARSGSYNVRSRVTDDDGAIHVDFSWSFKLEKTWGV